MPINFNQIKLPKIHKQTVEPIELFHSLKRTEINDLWLAQGQALQEWHEHRTQRDVAIMLNTGAGKTLVGLLVAQSLVNENQGHVLYTCSSIQLVEQTSALAQNYGLDVTTYFRGNFSNDLYHQYLAPCVTTYQALFNGRSRFFDDGVGGVIFDDAHTAEHLIRDHFTLKIQREAYPELFNQLTALFQGYHDRIDKGVGYRETFNLKSPLVSWFIPPFALYEQLGELTRLLMDAELTEHQETMFAWAYLRDHLSLCTLFISGREIAFTPYIVPVNTLPYFGQGVRRIYLSATLAANDVLLRTFGRVPDRIIKPVTTAGESERLIIVPRLNPSSGRTEETKEVAEADTAKAILADHKSLVLVPTFSKAEAWHDVPDLVVGQRDVAAQITDFKRTVVHTVLVLAGRYDGVDLPGDACRVLIIDGLPTGAGQLDRYLWDTLGLVKSLRSVVGSRVIQSFGRISRGMNDYGVVVLKGKDLVYWLFDSQNRALLPQFLQTQLRLGIELSRQADSLDDLVDAARQCLERDPDWLTYYERRDEIDGEFEPSTDEPNTLGEAVGIAEVEVKFGHALWEGDFEGAARALDARVNETFKVSANLGAWHRLWLGYCYQRLNNDQAAMAQYRQAHSALKAIPPFVPSNQVAYDASLPTQALEVARYLDGGLQVRRDILEEFDAAAAALKGAASPNSTEEALRALGQYLGLEASRPDNEYGTGPDVLWSLPGSISFCMEAKTDKVEGTLYRKRDVSQLYNHVQWIIDHVDGTTPGSICKAFIGPVAPAAADANPSVDIVVIELDQFDDLAQRVRAALVDICTRATVVTLPTVVAEILQQRDLLWPALYTGLSKRTLRDIDPGDKKTGGVG